MILIGFKYKASGNILRTILIFLILICIANPSIVSENRENIPDTVALILDLSPSQNINNRNKIAQEAYDNLKIKLQKIDNLDLRFKIIQGKNGTNIFEPLSAMVADIPPDRVAGAIVITDGQIQDAPKDLDKYNFKAPVNFLLSGKKDEKDRRLIIESAPRFGIVGEEIEILGIREPQKTTCTGVEMFRKLLDSGQAGDNVGVLLRGTKREEVERGQVLCIPGSVKPHTKFECEIYVLSKDEGGRHTPFFANYRPQFYFRTTDVTGAIELPKDVEMVMPGDNVKIKVELITPIAMEEGLKFAIREGGKTVGAGVVAKITE